MADAAWNVFKESRKSAKRAQAAEKGETRAVKEGISRRYTWRKRRRRTKRGAVTRVRIYLEKEGLKNTPRISSRWKSILVWFHFNAFSKHVAFFADYWRIRGSVVMLGRIPSVSWKSDFNANFWRATGQTRKVLWIYSRRFAEALMSLGERERRERERERRRRIGRVGKNVWAN